MKYAKYLKQTYRIFFNILIPLNNTQKLLKNISAEQFLSLNQQTQFPRIKNSLSV